MLQVRGIVITDVVIVATRTNTEMTGKAGVSHQTPAVDMTIALVVGMIERTGIDAGTSQVTDPNETMTETTETDLEAIGVSEIAPGVTATTVTETHGEIGSEMVASILLKYNKSAT